MANTYVYEFGNSLYLNLTNRCPNSCDFCLRNFKDGVNGNGLWLQKEPDFEELKEDLSKRDFSRYDEAVFCGFGEPTCNLEMMSKIGPYIKSRGCKIRLNTNGLGNLVNGGADVAKQIAAYVDYVSISLNASTAEGYDAICHSIYGKDAFQAMLDFASDCVREGIDTTMSVVDCIGEEEIAACAKIVEATGAKFRVRETIDETTVY
ncbi:MAG: TatD family nuclease-associated radical SAM protein [Bacteroides sp.]|nr:TatD family nuclease-associated radical SAM protein [Bacillota bacterium]MCM1393392.1 TatD family nuclease-associated radical SAM protein [[Eubacterium] siraeum]MCM1455540.1 TatD family nuclease-associated radical SAM protein [Bacteroides sp.]